MIFIRVKGTLMVSYANYPLTFTSLNRLNNCFAFSTLKGKAEKYLCCAVTYSTLNDTNLKELYSLKKL